MTKHLVVLLLGVGGWAGVHAQTGMMSYVPQSPGAISQVGKWVVANSTTNLQITNPDGTTSLVAKAAATTQSLTFFTLPANAVIESCLLKTTTAFTGTTTLTATAGITGSLTACVSAAYDLKAAVSNTNLSTPIAIIPTPSIASTAAVLALTSTVDNISSISAGSVTIWMKWYVLP